MWTSDGLRTADVALIHHFKKLSYGGENIMCLTTCESLSMRSISFFDYVLEVKPNSIVIYNDIFFEWPFVEARARIFGIGIEDEIGFARDSADDYKSRNCIRIDAFRWVKRDSYLPVGSQYLKSVAKANLHCDPVEVIQKMSEMATKEPQSLASYSISGIVATYYLYMKYVHPFVLCCVQSFRLDQMIYRQGTGGGLDLPLEQAIANASASFTEADMLIAQFLGKEAVMSGVGRMESFVDKERTRFGGDSDSSESTLGGNRRRRRAGGRANLDDVKQDGGRERRASVSDSIFSAEVASSPPLIDKDELKRNQRKRILKRLQDFDSCSSSSSERIKRRRTFTKAVNELQLTVLKSLINGGQHWPQENLTLQPQEQSTPPQFLPAEGDANLARSQTSSSLFH
ncbi:unnamed protein product [Cylicocyclus nassatus]|uniref:DNA polymerase epsilon catalytic subunit n=1 Tax=Cylicocyclus nassatus TaxID=53992 RepID=A0AA36DNC1_CYLNA|nr:unnamed protein product [Cylicocyclus nassatus]